MSDGSIMSSACSVLRCSDWRGVLITLTPTGRRLVDEAATAHLANERRILAGLAAAEQHQLAGLLRKLNLTLPPVITD
jgi:DNA-binding MarR family transcriptional regulator